jgi:alkylation response protein AidB-like acyl-CoA dehydrogenase
MDWADTPHQAEFRSAVLRFIEHDLPEYYRDPEKSRASKQGGEGDYQTWQDDMMHGTPEAQAAARDWNEQLLARGWAAPGWPEEYGGGGLSTMEQFILKQELARQQVPEVGSRGGGGQIGPTLLLHGTDEQKQRFLQPTLSGEYLWAQGYSEPGAGSDLASLQCRAVRDGDEYVINGQKMWTSNGHRSTWAFVLVRTDPEAPKHRGISFLLTSMDDPGISVRPIISMGWRHATNEVFFENVRVPADQIVGEENRGWYVAMTLLDFERSAISGAMQQRSTLDKLIEHVRNDRSPNRRALLRRSVADRHIEVEVSLNFSLRIASMQASGLIPNYEASMAKAFGSELSQRLSRTGTRAFGLYGALWDEDDVRSPLHAEHIQTYVSSVVGTIAGGSNEIQRNIIATRGLGLPRG